MCVLGLVGSLLSMPSPLLLPGFIQVPFRLPSSKWNLATLSLSVSTRHFPGNLSILGRLCVLNWSHQTNWEEACAPWVGERLSLLSLGMSMEMCFPGCCWQPVFNHANRPSVQKADKLRLQSRKMGGSSCGIIEPRTSAACWTSGHC